MIYLYTLRILTSYCSPKYVEFVVVTVGEASIEGGNFQTSDYNWGLWITQLPCDGSRLLTAPTGCFQYFLESSGIMRSYNYQGGQYLNNQVTSIESHYQIKYLLDNIYIISNICMG